MSATNTGTPAAESCSAITCSVSVFPVPVAPAIRPWRLIIRAAPHAGLGHDLALVHALPSSTAGPSDAYALPIVFAKSAMRGQS